MHVHQGQRHRPEGYVPAARLAPAADRAGPSHHQGQIAEQARCDCPGEHRCDPAPGRLRRLPHLRGAPVRRVASARAAQIPRDSPAPAGRLGLRQRREGEAQIARLFAQEKLPPLWVPYADPGYMLARKIAGLVEEYQQEHRRKPQILFLEKHGVFVTADSANAALRLVRKVIERCESRLKSFACRGSRRRRPRMSPSSDWPFAKAVFDATGQYVPVSYYPATAPIAAFMAHRDGRALLAAPALHPEELVFANGPALWVENTDPARITRGIQTRVARTRKAPYAFIVRGLDCSSRPTSRSRPWRRTWRMGP